MTTRAESRIANAATSVQSRSRMRSASIVRLAIGVAAIVGAVLLFRYAVAVWPVSSDRHGQALDGLDGLGTFVGLLSGAGGVLLSVLGVALARPALRRRRVLVPRAGLPR